MKIELKRCDYWIVHTLSISCNDPRRHEGRPRGGSVTNTPKKSRQTPCPSVPYRGPEAGNPRSGNSHEFHGWGANPTGSSLFLQSRKINSRPVFLPLRTWSCAINLFLKTPPSRWRSVLNRRMRRWDQWEVILSAPRSSPCLRPGPAHGYLLSYAGREDNRYLYGCCSKTIRHAVHYPQERGAVDGNGLR